MRYFFAFFLLVASAAGARAQIGFGGGTDGLNVKSSPFRNLRLIGRTNFGLGLDDFVTAEVNGVAVVFRETDTQIYAGGGLGARYLIDDDDIELLIRAPVGIEVFPAVSSRFGAAIESGLSYQTIGESSQFGLDFVVEATFYLTRR